MTAVLSAAASNERAPPTLITQPTTVVSPYAAAISFESWLSCQDQPFWLAEDRDTIPYKGYVRYDMVEILKRPTAHLGSSACCWPAQDKLDEVEVEEAEDNQLVLYLGSFFQEVLEGECYTCIVSDLPGCSVNDWMRQIGETTLGTEVVSFMLPHVLTGLRGLHKRGLVHNRAPLLGLSTSSLTMAYVCSFSTELTADYVFCLLPDRDGEIQRQTQELTEQDRLQEAVPMTPWTVPPDATDGRALECAYDYYLGGFSMSESSVHLAVRQELTLH